MLSTNFSKLRLIHTTGTNSAVADTLSRYFSKVTGNTCQLIYQILPPHIEVLQFQPDDSLKQVQSFVKNEE